MSVFFRKSAKFGPIRLNFNKSGVGVSAGIKGLRVGVNAKGKSYIAGGSNGIYFKQNLSSNQRLNQVTNQVQNTVSSTNIIPTSTNNYNVLFFVFVVTSFLCFISIELIFIPTLEH